MAFHPYPQLIRVVFNPQRFGPPPGVTPASPWPWIDRFGFGSAPTYSSALFRLAFASAPALKALTSHVRSNSPDHNAKGTQSPADGSEEPPQAPTACMHTVSGSLSLAVRRAFHRSLTVLSTIGHELVFSLGGWSPQIRPGFLVPRPTRVLHQLRYQDFVYGTLTRYGPPFQARSTTPSRRLRGAPQPRTHHWIRFGLFPFRSPLLRESRLISLPPGTEMFQFPGLATACAADRALTLPGFPIRTPPDHSSRAAPRGFSQLATSFIAGSCLGIHRVHFFA